MFDSHPLSFGQGFENGSPLPVFKVLKKIDNLITFQVAHRLGQNIGAQRCNHFFANTLIKLGENVAVKLFVIKINQTTPVKSVDLFQKVRDIGRM